MDQVTRGGYTAPSSNAAGPAQTTEVGVEKHSSGHFKSLTWAMLSVHSTAALNAKIVGGNEKEKKLAMLAEQAILGEGLMLSPNQRANSNAQFGVKYGQDPLVIIAKLEGSKYDILSIGLRSEAEPLVLPRPSTAVASTARHSPAPLGFSNEMLLRTLDSAAPTAQRLTEQGESSSAASMDTSSNARLIANNNKIIKQLVTKLNKWDRKNCVGIIDEKLKGEPAEKQQLLLQDLNKKLSNLLTDKKPECIQQWATRTTSERIIEDRDTRKPHERALHEKVLQQLKNPDFRKVHDEMCLLLEPGERAKIKDKGIFYGNYKSPLYKRVFSGKLPPLEAIQNIKQKFDSAGRQQKYQAILDWKNE
jgi:hypothetical protein